MKSSILALIIAAGLSAPALAQQAAPADAGHGAHHPEAAQEEPSTPSTGAQAPTGAQMRSMMGQGGMMSGMGSNMMMNCPMMQGGMQMGQPRGDQGVGSLALNAINQRMHREMAMEYTGNVDADFVRNMVAHHRGAIDMARVVAAFGKDPKIRELAQNIIKAQEDEITMMKSWLAENAKQ